jgi:hypothetical protein
MCAPEKGGSAESWFSRKLVQQKAGSAESWFSTKLVQHKDGSAYLPFYDGEGGIVERTKKLPHTSG